MMDGVLQESVILRRKLPLGNGVVEGLGCIPGMLAILVSADLGEGHHQHLVRV